MGPGSSKVGYLRMLEEFHSLTRSGIWKIIKGWLDPVVAGKVHFTNNVEELEEFIDKSHIIKELGGDDPWAYEYVEPNVKENEQMSNDAPKTKLLEEREEIVKQYESATHEWIRTSQDATRQKKNELAEKLRTGYWQLDPYIRARSMYDRTGIIQNGGKVDFYPTSKVVEEKPAPNGPPPAGAGPDDLD